MLRGSAAALERVRREVRGDLLQLTFDAPAGTSNTVVALGGRATQRIGSLTSSVGIGTGPSRRWSSTSTCRG